MKSKKKLIGLSGKARSGKDTAGKLLMLRQGFHRMAFADPLKHAMAATFGIEVSEFHSDDLKDQVHPGWQLSRRTMLQQGADALRDKFGQDLFIRRWLTAYLAVADLEHVVVTDVRCVAEAEAIRELGGEILLLERSGAGLQGTTAGHHTESGLPEELINHRLENNGTECELWDQLLDYLGGPKHVA